MRVPWRFPTEATVERNEPVAANLFQTRLIDAGFLPMNGRQPLLETHPSTVDIRCRQMLARFVEKFQRLSEKPVGFPEVRQVFHRGPCDRSLGEPIAFENGPQVNEFEGRLTHFEAFFC